VTNKESLLKKALHFNRILPGNFGGKITIPGFFISILIEKGYVKTK